MADKFRLDFFVEGNSVGLKLTWVNNNQSVVLPSSFWPRDEDHLREVIETTWPSFGLNERAAKFQEKRRKAELRKALFDTGNLIRKVTVTSGLNNKKYEITIAGKKITCSCPDFVFRRKSRGQHCKHISRWLKTKIGKDTYKRVNLPKPKEPCMSVEQLEYAQEHMWELREILQRYNMVSWL